jgi:predicted nucleic acid-binding protein
MVKKKMTKKALAKKMTKKALAQRERSRINHFRGFPGFTIDENGRIWGDESGMWDYDPNEIHPKHWVYIDTSVIIALFDDRHPRRKKYTERFISSTERFEFYYSDITLLELQRMPDSDLKEKMLHALDPLMKLSQNHETETLAKTYIERGIPKSHPEAAVHLAIANVNHVNTLATWDYQHINAPKIRELVNSLNKQNKHTEIYITTPEYLW